MLRQQKRRKVLLKKKKIYYFFIFIIFYFKVFWLSYTYIELFWIDGQGFIQDFQLGGTWNFFCNEVTHYLTICDSGKVDAVIIVVGDQKFFFYK